MLNGTLLLPQSGITLDRVKHQPVVRHAMRFGIYYVVWFIGWGLIDGFEGDLWWQALSFALIAATALAAYERSTVSRESS